MENHTTKIPRLREARYARSLKTCLELKPSRTYIESQPSQMKRAFSLTDIEQYKTLKPEQYIVKYKSYPHKFCKKSCIICSMRKPQHKNKSFKVGDPKVDSMSIYTQTIPPNPPPERWNAQTQTKTHENTEIKSAPDPKQTKHQNRKQRSFIYILSCFLWFCLPIAIILIGMLIIQQMDALKWVTRKQLRQPNTILEKLISYFHRDKILSEGIDRSAAHVNIPEFMFSIGLSLIFTLAVKILYQ